MSLNDEQENIALLATQGHNMFIDGPAGTGKTFLLRNICEKLRSDGKRVALTCTTGIACNNYVDACTIHRWSGLHDGRYNSSEVLTIVANNNDALERITNTDVLIVDEISMLSLKLFEQLNDICCLKDKTQPWGGIQVIVSGDFKQLPPTANKLYNDNGVFCFHSALFKRFHHVQLTKVVRQTDAALISAINDISEGCPLKQQTIDFMSTVSRPLENENTVKLFSKRDLVDAYNRKQIMSMPGEIYEYVSTDSGDIKKLFNITAPSKLWLKKSCPVILTRNISRTLVNGLQGTVIECESDGPIVKFPCETVKVKKTSFSVFSPRENKTLANREQIPLLLSFALTIHKAQGMTLDSVEVDCRDTFAPGQLGVAIGRVRTVQGLRVINFNPKYCIPQPGDIEQYNLEPAVPVQDDLSCCKYSLKENITAQGNFWVDAEWDDPDGETEEDFDEEFNNIMASIGLDEFSDDVQLPQKFDLNSTLKQCLTNVPVTPVQQEVNDLVNKMLLGDLADARNFCKKQFAALTDIVKQLGVTAEVGVKAEKLNSFYAECHRYQTSDTFKVACMLLFKDCVCVSHAHSHVCSHLTNSVRQFLLQETVESFKAGEHALPTRSVTKASKARIRYVGGYCVHSALQKFNTIRRSNMYSTSANGQLNYENAEQKIAILNGLTEREEVLKATSKEPDSLLDTEQRQYQSRGLINITDGMYHFFCQVCGMCLQLLVQENLNMHGENLYQYCLSELLKSSKLLEALSYNVSLQSKAIEEFSTSVIYADDTSVISCVLLELSLTAHHVLDLFKELVAKYLHIMINQFRKDILESMSVEKTLSHRKQIQIRKQKAASTTSKFSFQTVVNDKTEGKDMSHALMKGMLLNKSSIFQGMTKKQINILCGAYDVSVKRNDKKEVLIKKLSDTIVTSTCMKNCNIIREQSGTLEMECADVSESEPGTSAIQPEPSSSEPGTSAIQPEPSPSEPGTSAIQPEPPSSTDDPDSIHTIAATVAEQAGIELDEDESCGKCGKVGKEGIQWIQCSSCNTWLHRNCAGLRSKAKWERFSNTSAQFYCNDCK